MGVDPLARARISPPGPLAASRRPRVPETGLPGARKLSSALRGASLDEERREVDDDDVDDEDDDEDEDMDDDMDEEDKDEEDDDDDDDDMDEDDDGVARRRRCAGRPGAPRLLSCSLSSSSLTLVPHRRAWSARPMSSDAVGMRHRPLCFRGLTHRLGRPCCGDGAEVAQPTAIAV